MKEPLIQQSIHITRELKNKITLMAIKDNRSLANMIRQLLESAVKEQE